MVRILDARLQHKSVFHLVHGWLATFTTKRFRSQVKKDILSVRMDFLFLTSFLHLGKISDYDCRAKCKTTLPGLSELPYHNFEPTVQTCQDYIR